jgi:hypothetical protein
MEDLAAVDPGVWNRRPVIRGTRITLEPVLEFLGAGDSLSELSEEISILNQRLRYRGFKRGQIAARLLRRAIRCTLALVIEPVLYLTYGRNQNDDHPARGEAER